MKRIVLLTIGLFSALLAYGQEQNFSTHSIKVATGIGFIDAFRESGTGSLFSVGYQKSLWKNRIRISPGLTMGNFNSKDEQDVRDQYFSFTSVGLQAQLDALKYRSLSLFVGAGGFGGRTSGLLGSGGDPGSRSSEYFTKLYMGGSAGIGLRIDPKNSRFAYEITPININVGNDYFSMVFARIGVDLKLK